jgi:hypothetical protein
MLLVPGELVEELVHGVVIFPDEPDFVQKSLSILSKFVVPMKGQLSANPQPKRLVMLGLDWPPTMAILWFEL